MPTAALLFAATLLFGSVGAVPGSRSIEAVYVASVEAVPAGLHRLEVWVPLPVSTADQEIRDVRVDSPYPGRIRRETEHGNSYFYFSSDEPRPGPLEIRVRFSALRREILRAALRPGVPPSSQDLAKYLKAEPSVTISPRVRELSRQATLGHTGDEAKIRAIYDYLVNTMIYDKTVPGWGKGDIERACDVRRGNCTDFHSLFMAMARAEGIPVRFIIGFPLKTDPEGTIPGYHCWAEFYLPQSGWIPVDASEASKSLDPARRDYLFGNLDPDRVQFTTGRDLRLDPPPCAETLNYFIYPYAEGDGNALTPVAIRLEYRAAPAGGAPVGGR
jgi:transglutaminase-like putative cysteine protease